MRGRGCGYSQVWGGGEEGALVSYTPGGSVMRAWGGGNKWTCKSEGLKGLNVFSVQTGAVEKLLNFDSSKGQLSSDRHICLV